MSESVLPVSTEKVSFQKLIFDFGLFVILDLLANQVAVVVLVPVIVLPIGSMVISIDHMKWLHLLVVLSRTICL